MPSKFLAALSICIAVSMLQTAFTSAAILGRPPCRRLVFRDEHAHPNRYRYYNAPYFYRRRLQDTEAAEAPNFDTATTSTSAEAAEVTAGTAERTTTKAMTFASPAVLASATITETTTIGNNGFGNGYSPFGGDYGYGFYPDDYLSNRGGYGYPGNGYPGNFGFGFPGNFGYESATGANTGTESIDANKPEEKQVTKPPST